MKVEIAKYPSFCFGVKKAVERAEKAAEKNSGMFSIGPIIHNPAVVGDLSKMGLKVVSELDGIIRGTLIIRTHGLHPALVKKTKERGLGIIDATCPFVKRSQEIVSRLHNEGYDLIIVGDRRHPEVEALLGFAEDKAMVIGSSEEAKRCELSCGRLGIIAQSTYGMDKYMKIVSAIMEGGFKELRVFNTICSDTTKRQRAALELAKRVDAMLVVGGRMSSNTKLLADMCKACGVETHHIEDVDDLDMRWLKAKERVGIVGGASTPYRTVKDIAEKIKQDPSP